MREDTPRKSRSVNVIFRRSHGSRIFAKLFQHLVKLVGRVEKMLRGIKLGINETFGRERVTSVVYSWRKIAVDLCTSRSLKVYLFSHDTFATRGVYNCSSGDDGL